MDKFEQFEYINELFEIYKNSLTAKQIDIMTKYYVYNLSLAEISEEEGVSRNAISDTIKHARNKLINLEENIHLYKKILLLKEELEKIKLTDEEKKRIIEVMYYGVWGIDRKISKNF